MKTVFDTNIYISALLFKGGIPSLLFDLALSSKIDLYFSPEILDELRDVLSVKFELTIQETERLIKIIESCGTLVYPQQPVLIVKLDPDDNKIIECALAARAKYIVTGDKKHLLSLKHKLDLKIISSREFYEIFFKETE